MDEASLADRFLRGRLSMFKMSDIDDPIGS